MRFRARDLARAWRSTAVASGTDKERPALLRTVLVEQFSHGVRLVATDSRVLLMSWCPTATFLDEAGDDSVLAPELDEVPLATAVAIDSHGRAKGFMAHAQQIAAVAFDETAAELEISLDLGVVLDEDDVTRLAGFDTTWCVMEMEGRERLQLRLFDGPFPDWRPLFAESRSFRTRHVALDLEVMDQLAKLAKIHDGAKLGWHLAGPERPARVEVLHARPEVVGLVTPGRWEFASARGSIEAVDGAP